MNRRVTNVTETITKTLKSATYMGQQFLFHYSLHYLVARAFFPFSPKRRKALKAEEAYLRKFREDGYCVMPDFVGDPTVDALEEELKRALYAPGQSPKWADNEDFSNIVKVGYPVEYLSHVQYIFDWGKDVSGRALGFLDEKFGRLLQRILRSNYCIEHIWFYETRNENRRETYNLNSNFHVDGDVSTAVKMIVYMCDVDKTNGPLAIRDAKTGEEIVITGKKGTAILFKANALYHAGKNTLSANRYALSFLIHPNIRYAHSYIQMPMDAARRENPFFAAC